MPTANWARKRPLSTTLPRQLARLRGLARRWRWVGSILHGRAPGDVLLHGMAMCFDAFLHAKGRRRLLARKLLGHKVC